MTDMMSKEERSRCMSAIRSRDTRPEMVVRRYLFSRGLRYRVADRKLPGSPDIVLRKYRTVVFVDGCFWHGHDGCRYYRMPHTNVGFWRHKINMNMARDYSNNVELALTGWRVIRIWECQMKLREERETLLSRLYEAIVDGVPFPQDSPSELLSVGKRVGNTVPPKLYGYNEDEELPMAAEGEIGNLETKNLKYI